mmetsp:Transcript_25698/g.46513  ORF Transcript_25698/g.46513 Transcript_25698/m.46513 type:complete len:97 (+) Transcript_25698:357-647(+)
MTNPSIRPVDESAVDFGHSPSSCHLLKNLNLSNYRKGYHGGSGKKDGDCYPENDLPPNCSKGYHDYEGSGKKDESVKKDGDNYYHRHRRYHHSHHH